MTITQKTSCTRFLQLEVQSNKMTLPTHQSRYQPYQRDREGVKQRNSDSTGVGRRPYEPYQRGRGGRPPWWSRGGMHVDRGENRPWTPIEERLGPKDLAEKANGDAANGKDSAQTAVDNGKVHAANGEEVSNNGEAHIDQQPTQNANNDRPVGANQDVGASSKSNHDVSAENLPLDADRGTIADFPKQRTIRIGPTITVLVPKAAIERSALLKTRPGPVYEILPPVVHRILEVIDYMRGHPLPEGALTGTNWVDIVRNANYLGIAGLFEECCTR